MKNLKPSGFSKTFDHIAFFHILLTKKEKGKYLKSNSHAKVVHSSKDGTYYLSDYFFKLPYITIIFF